MRFRRELLTGAAHVDALASALADLRSEAPRLDAWAATLLERLTAGGRLLACGNGGSAAEAQHLTGELVGRYRDDRRPFSALCLCVESASVTAIGNDYGAEAVFARQVQAHGRPDDVLVAFSTSGRSPNVLAAAEAARGCGMLTWGFTGAAPNPLTEICHDALSADTPHTATAQEVHLVAIHLLCAALDARLARSDLREVAA